MSTIAETADPIKELDPAVKLIPKDVILERFDAVTDVMAPTEDGRKDKIYITQSCDSTTHFESTCNDIINVYERITGKTPEWKLPTSVAQVKAAPVVAVPNSDIRKQFSTLVTEGKFNNFTFKVGDKTFTIPKVLVARSPDFIAAFPDALAAGEVTLEGVPASAVGQYIEFLIGDSIPSLDDEGVKALRALSEAHKLTRLQDYCDKGIEYKKTLERDLVGLNRADAKPGSDVNFITADGKTIPSYKFILVARSEYFKTLFASGMAESASGEIKTDLPSKTILQMLDFFSSGDVELEGDSVSGLLAAADRYNIPALKAKCEEFIASNLDISNVESVYKDSVSLHADQLREQCVYFLACNAKDKKVAAFLGAYIDLAKEVGTKAKEWGV